MDCEVVVEIGLLEIYYYIVISGAERIRIYSEVNFNGYRRLDTRELFRRISGEIQLNPLKVFKANSDTIPEFIPFSN